MRTKQVGLCVLGAALASLAITATASAGSTVVAYNNLNTVPTTVNGLPDQDTYSEAPFQFPFGGLVELGRAGVMDKLTVQLDSFTCEHGVYSSENCWTFKPSKKFKYALTAEVFSVAAGHEPGTLLAKATQTFKIPYRPTTNISCPATSEGKGFGANCDVGGYLTTATFKKFQTFAALAPEVIVLIKAAEGNNPNDVVNVGLQSAYKEYNSSLSEPFVAEPPLNGGQPEIGNDPLSGDAYVNGKLHVGGYEGFQPAFEIIAKQ